MANNRVLLADSSPLIALDMGEFLSEAGFMPVGPAFHVEAARSLAMTEPLGGAVLDIALNGEPVWPVTEILHRRGIPFILLITHPLDIANLPPSCHEARLVEKPFVPGLLVSTLASIAKPLRGDPGAA